MPTTHASFISFVDPTTMDSEQAEPECVCFLCGKPHHPTRRDCPQCAGFVVPTRERDKKTVIPWTIAVFSPSATDEERAEAINLARSITRAERNVAICGVELDSEGKPATKTILIRTEHEWRLSFKEPDPDHGKKRRALSFIAKEIGEAELARFGRIIAIKRDGERKKQCPMPFLPGPRANLRQCQAGSGGPGLCSRATMLVILTWDRNGSSHECRFFVQKL